MVRDLLDQPQPAYIFKICLLGAAAVGKTCICRRLCFDTFDANTKLTIGIDFYTYNLPIIINNGEKESFIRLSIWDFGGQEQFKKLFHYYINGVNGIFVAFELINLQSLINLDWWYDQLAELGFDKVPKIVIGTKQDLVESTDPKAKVNDLVIRQFLKKHGENDFLKTSSKENVNILNSFKRMTAKILDDHNLPYETLI
ncbi:MAG: GTP-binding protein [Promethearchaeota archaeon]|nr:MAG: GTP-binding protein [Candidatus Lokiarchaeota archaeon]